MRIEIPMKLPSLNEYINKCRYNRFAGNKMKQDVEQDILLCLSTMPKYDRPIKIHFTWVEKNNKRDYDNICFAKKFILDAMQKAGKLNNDNRKWVIGFTDSFELGQDYKVILDITEV